MNASSLLTKYCENCEKARPSFEEDFCSKCLCPLCKKEAICKRFSTDNEHYDFSICTLCNSHWDNAVDSDDSTSSDSSANTTEIVDKLLNDDLFVTDTTSIHLSPTIEVVIDTTSIHLSPTIEVVTDTTSIHLSPTIEADKALVFTETSIHLSPTIEVVIDTTSIHLSPTIEVVTDTTSIHLSPTIEADKALVFTETSIHLSPTIEADNVSVVTDTTNSLVKYFIDPQIVMSLITKDLNGLGHDANGASTNGELRIASCKLLQQKLKLCESDVLLDGGCSGGTALLVLVALSGCIGIGIELDVNRWALATKHSQSLMANLNDYDFRVCFEHNDIFEYENFNGITVLYMFDCAFDKSNYPSLVKAICESKTLRCFVSSLKLDYYRNIGLAEAWHQSDTIEIQAIGGSCSRVLYIYCTNIDDGRYANVINEDIESLLKIAKNKEIRTKYVDDEYHAWSTFEEYIRTTKIPADEEYFKKQSNKLYKLLDNNSYYQNDSIKRFYEQGTLTETLITRKYR